MYMQEQNTKEIKKKWTHVLILASQKIAACAHTEINKSGYL